MAKRRTITIKLRPGIDDDIWQWFNSLPPGTWQAEGGRNAALKSALRAGLGLPAPEVRPANHIEDEMNALRGWLQQIADDLPGYVQGEIARAGGGNAAAPAVASVTSAGELSEDELSTRKRKLDRATW